MGYQREIEYFIQCVKENRPPTTVTLEDGAEAVRIVEAEVESIRTGWPVSPTGAEHVMTSIHSRHELEHDHTYKLISIQES